MTIDLIEMIGNLSRSLFSVERLLTGLAYLIGLVFFMVALMKLRKVAAAGRGSQEKMIIPLAYFLGGAILLYIPTSLNMLSNTVFGVGNILQYTKYNPYDLYASIRVLIQVAGLIWFIRGTVLVVHASDPGVQHGAKGLAFLFAGVLAINFESTTSFLATVMNFIVSTSASIKSNQGY